MERERTMFEKALIGDYEIKDVFTNIERCKEISDQLQILDIIDPNSRNVGLLAELVYRVSNMPELELIELDEYALNNPN
jgi:hypothetical protein|tara:strand:- start:80 stop:316 length:237 start_codon:yes stop_codon:yes gene_type:complete